MSQPLEFHFYVNGTVRQEIVLEKEYKHLTKENLIDLFKAGDLFTSISFNREKSEPLVLLFKDGKFIPIGTVISQEPEDDLEISFDEKEDFEDWADE
jgi:hypothetical protein